MKKRISTIILTIISLLSSASTKEIWMIGPMLHINIGSEKIRPSIALEVSYWNYESFPYSIDGGVEFEKSRVRVYSELQAGIGLAGVSCGPLVEFRTDEGAVKGGFQGSMWANFFWGFDIRFRSAGGAFYFSPGTYFKIPLKAFELDEEEESDDDNETSKHRYSWDWDD